MNLVLGLSKTPVDTSTFVEEELLTPKKAPTTIPSSLRIQNKY